MHCAFINTTSVESVDGGHRSWTKTVTHLCQPIYTGVHGAVWENLYIKFVEIEVSKSDKAKPDRLSSAT